MFPFCEEEAAHYGYDKEFFSLNLLDTSQAEFAIRKWLLPEVKNWTAQGCELRREAARVCISQAVAFSDFWLPGISDRWKLTGDLEEFSVNISAFQKLVWKNLFVENYTAMPLEIYVRRIDKGFERFPDFPDLWTDPICSEWPANFNSGVPRLKS
jgi:hypothetical protein